MCLLLSLYVAVLFFVLTPGILLSLPKGGSKFKVAGVHALVFAVIFYFTHKLVWRFGVTLEGMTDPTEGVPSEGPEPVLATPEPTTSGSYKKNATTMPIATTMPSITMPSITMPSTTTVPSSYFAA